jgi:dihydrofolate reductase
MIWAEARGIGGRGAIGRGGEMPWHLPEDLAHFRRTTTGAPVLMGRRTWESLPERFRPLPGRENVVVTRDPEFDAPGATVAHSLDEALAAVRDHGAELGWIMGGGQLYRAAMPLADELVVTRIELDVPDADTFAPEIPSDFTLREETGPETSSTGLRYTFQRWVRRSPGNRG